jgi:cytochrome o ubiquinol oxidase operon protein cyoD
MKKNIQHSPFNAYLVGFLLSIVLTLVAYLFVVNHILAGWILFAAIIILAFVQLLVQLIFFLHLGQESKPRWNLLFLLSTISIILTIVLASLWIMNHLNYNMMPPMDTKTYLINQP